MSVVILLGVLYPRRMLFLPRFRMGWGLAAATR